MSPVAHPCRMDKLSGLLGEARRPRPGQSPNVSGISGPEEESNGPA